MDKAVFSVASPPAFVLNLLTSSGYHLKNIKKTESELIFSIDSRRAAEIIKLMEKKNVRFVLRYTDGVKTRTGGILKRFGFLLGALIGAAVLVLYCMTVTGVKVEGLDKVAETEILRVISENGVKFPYLSSENDYETLENRITEIDGIASAVVRRDGTNLLISVSEGLKPHEIIDKNEPVPVTAQYDGVIKSIVTVQGTPLVKTGDAVRKGDVLIAPYIKDAEGKEIPLRAMGEAYITVWFQKHLFFGDTVIAEARTGRMETKTSIEVLGLNYLPKCSFSKYQAESAEETVFALLPYKIITTVFYETEEREVKFDFEKQKDNIIEKEINALKSLIPNGAKEIKWWHIEKRLDKSTALSIYYEVEIKIT